MSEFHAERSERYRVSSKNSIDLSDVEVVDHKLSKDLQKARREKTWASNARRSKLTSGLVVAVLVAFWNIASVGGLCLDVQSREVFSC